MAGAADDWVSTSPINLPEAARARSYTPGRVLSRNEIRQQRRRGDTQCGLVYEIKETQCPEHF